METLITETLDRLAGKAQMTDGTLGCVGDHTFEVDLFRSGWHELLASALSSPTTNGAAKKRASECKEQPASLDADAYPADIAPIGKGRFAQRIATELEGLAKAPPCRVTSRRPCDTS